MQFQILGDCGVEAEGTWYPVSAARQRAAFLLFALSANREVSRSALVDAIWGERVPQHPDAALHIVVSRLRTAIGPAACRLVSVSSAYRLDIAADELDYMIVQAEFVRGRSLLRDNDATRAADVLGASLEQWTGETLTGLEELPFYEQARGQLHELRASIEETRYEALLAAGRHIEVLATVQAAVAADPWREQLRRHHMIALYRSGRQVEALRVYDVFRTLLVDELGVEPSNELSELHVQILDQDSSLLLARAGLAQPIPPWTATSLPWVGRRTEEELIFLRLRTLRDAGERMVVIEGEPGIGKTRLLMEVGRRVSDDAILVAATANNVARGPVVALAEGLADASSGLSDAELELCLGEWAGDIAAAVPRIGRRLDDAQLHSSDLKTRADRLREGVAQWIVTLSQRAPVVLLLDDLQRAGPGLLLFLARLFERSGHQRVLVLATVTSRTSDYAAKLEMLLRELDDKGCLDRLELGGLDYHDIESMVSQLGIADAASRARSLYDATAGHPFFVGEMLHEEDSDVSLPSSVRDFVRHRVRGLGPGAEASLICASCLVTGFDASLLSSIAEITETAAIAHLERATAAGVLREVDAHVYMFAHDLTRRALRDSLDADTAARVHRRIALAFESRDEAPALLATHWQLAAGDDARANTYTYASAAAEDARRSLDPDTAAHWLGIAVAGASTPTEHAIALLALADAQHQAADAAGVETLRDAIRSARELGDPDLVVACALAWTPVWGSMPPLDVDERISLLEDALAVATSADDRSRLLARLATELLHTEQRERARELADDALRTARDADVRSVPPEVALRYFHATWSPHTLPTRRALMEETLASAPSDDVVNRCIALAMFAAAALEAVERPKADAALDAMLELAESQGMSALTLNAVTTRTWRSALEGDLAAAGTMAMDALGLARNDATASNGVILQLAYIAWQQGRFAELLPFIEQLDVAVAGSVTTRVMTARALAALERRDAAVDLLESITPSELVDLPKDMLWSGTLLFAAETAFMLQNTTLGACIRELLEPFRALVAVANFVLAPIAYGAGIAAAAARHDDFHVFFSDALEVSRRLDAPVLQARTEIAWVVAEHALHGGEPDAALVADARAICEKRQLPQLETSGDPTTWRLR